MRSLLIIFALMFPIAASGQSFTGTYRAVFFNLFSTPSTMVAEFEVKADNSLSGKLRIDQEIRDFASAVDKKGRFEAIIEQNGNATFKIKGKFGKANKISLIQRTQASSGLNKSVSENSLEGTFSRFEKPRESRETAKVSQSRPELVDTGRSWLKIQNPNPLFGADWTDFTAQINFGNAAKNTINSDDPPDYFSLVIRSKVTGQQALRLNVQLYTADKKVWNGNEFRSASYREARGEERNSFLLGGASQKDSIYAEGTLEIVRETETQIVFKLTDFKIKQFTKDGFVEINGFIYADKYKP